MKKLCMYCKHGLSSYYKYHRRFPCKLWSERAKITTLDDDGNVRKDLHIYWDVVPFVPVMVEFSSSCDEFEPIEELEKEK
jgi:hypothetical protein